MVVNGGRKINLVTMCSNNFDMTPSTPAAMAGMAVFICQQNSHPFLDRTLNLDHPMKIGRSVARARASQTNGIFDCKVLSRNHALLWYANEKFFLQDTKSSNGTFVNNQRLSKSGEESPPREVYSGDVVQFGVDVLENSRKVTHGCIIAHLKLYHPDGKEAKPSALTTVISSVESVPVEDLYQLNQHIQEALQREQMLQTKLVSLQQLVMSLQQSSDLSWKALIAEDRLLSRLETLETQLQTYSKNFPEDKLREELRKLNEDKSIYQSTAKECLKKILEEKVEAVQKWEDIKLTLMNTEAECANFKALMEQSQTELKELALKHTALIVKTEELEEKLQAFEKQSNDVTRLETVNEELTNEIQRSLTSEVVLQEKIKNLEAALGFKLEIQPKANSEQFTEIYDDITDVPTLNEESDEDTFEESVNDVKFEDPDYIKTTMDSLFLSLADAINNHKKTKEIADILKAQIDVLTFEKAAKAQKMNSLTYDLEIQNIQLHNHKRDSSVLQNKLDSLQQRFIAETIPTHTLKDTTLKEEIGDINSSFNKTTLLDSLQVQICQLKEMLIEARKKAEMSEQEVKVIELELDMGVNNLKCVNEKLSNANQKLKDADRCREQREKVIAKIKQKVLRLETMLMEKALQEKLDAQLNTINKQEETLQLRNQLIEALQVADQSKKELEQTKEHLRIITEESDKKSKDDSNTNKISERHLDNRTFEDFEAVNQECKSLREAIKTLESQVIQLNVEKKLQSEFLEESRSNQETERSMPAAQVEEQTKSLNLKIIELEEELVLVKERYMTCIDNKTCLERDLVILKQDYQALCVPRSYYVPQQYLLSLAIVPLLVAIYFAIGIFSFS